MTDEDVLVNLRNLAELCKQWQSIDQEEQGCVCVTVTVFYRDHGLVSLDVRFLGAFVRKWHVAQNFGLGVRCFCAQCQ